MVIWNTIQLHADLQISKLRTSGCSAKTRVLVGICSISLSATQIIKEIPSMSNLCAGLSLLELTELAQIACSVG